MDEDRHLKGDPRRMPLGRFDSTRLNEARFVLGPNPIESEIDPEIVKAVRAIRGTGIETLSSSAGTTNSLTAGWGSFILLNLMLFPRDKQIPQGLRQFDSLMIVTKIRHFADSITEELRRELGNPNISLQLVLDERAAENKGTTAVQSRGGHDIYRLQLVGFADDKEISFAWGKVAQKFNRSIVE